MAVPSSVRKMRAVGGNVGKRFGFRVVICSEAPSPDSASCSESRKPCQGGGRKPFLTRHLFTCWAPLYGMLTSFIAAPYTSETAATNSFCSDSESPSGAPSGTDMMYRKRRKREESAHELRLPLPDPAGDREPEAYTSPSRLRLGTLTRTPKRAGSTCPWAIAGPTRSVRVSLASALDSSLCAQCACLPGTYTIRIHTVTVRNDFTLNSSACLHHLHAVTVRSDLAAHALNASACLARPLSKVRINGWGSIPGFSSPWFGRVYPRPRRL